MAVAASALRRGTGIHWAKRPLPEPPRTRRISKWTREKRDELLEDWLKDQALTNTYDAD